MKDSNQPLIVDKTISHLTRPIHFACLEISWLFAWLQVSGTIRNCCFEAENQLQNLLLISEFLWPALLLPVAGNKVAFYTVS